MLAIDLGLHHTDKSSYFPFDLDEITPALVISLRALSDAEMSSNRDLVLKIEADEPVSRIIQHHGIAPLPYSSDRKTEGN